MAGHSKWAKIHRGKAIEDAKRGAVFTKLGNAIAIAARAGADPDTNFALRLAIDKAKAANMPSNNIDRAIDRVKDKSAAALQELLYEAYGPGGTAILIAAATDNTNRTFPEVRTAVTKHGGSMADKGSVAFQFTHKGEVRVGGVGDDIVLQALDAGAEDVYEDDGESVLMTDPRELAMVRDAAKTAGLTVTEAALTYIPNNTLTIADAVTAGKIIRMMDALDACDDVTATYVNFDIPEEFLS